jgi:hypothetical protein
MVVKPLEAFTLLATLPRVCARNLIKCNPYHGYNAYDVLRSYNCIIVRR